MFSKNKVLFLMSLSGICYYAIFLLPIDYSLPRWKTQGHERFLIDTPGCKILNYEPAPVSLLEYFKEKKVICSTNKYNQVTSSKMNILSFYPENINYRYLNGRSKKRLRDLRRETRVKKGNETLRLRDILTKEGLSCCYKTIERRNPILGSKEKVDELFQLSGNCYEIISYETMIKVYDAIAVYCSSSKKRNFYADLHFLVQDKRKRNIFSTTFSAERKEEKDDKLKEDKLKDDKLKDEKLKEDKLKDDKLKNDILKEDKLKDNKLKEGILKEDKLKDDKLKEDKLKDEKLNVIIFGTDSVSRLNFLRFNKKTYNYLINELNAFEFKGYNKVGDNTLPNVLALLTGHLQYDKLNQECSHYYKGHFDNCSFIWEDFHRMGYITALMEDCAFLGTFNYKQKGFVNPPTDHYLRPGFLAMDKVLKTTCNYCMGGRLIYEVLHAYSHDFQVTYQNALTFSFFWASKLTHDVLTQAASIDEPHLRYLKSLKEDGLLNNTILFFLSDHGIRFGKFRETYLGKYEENLPYLFIVAPEWFHQKYPMASKNLRENGQKWFTPLDVYETLYDVLHEKYSDIPYLIEKPYERSKRISLFRNLPETRTCTDIDMPINFCACQNFLPIKDNEDIFKNISLYLKEYINKILTSYPQCAKITSLEVKKGLIDSGEKVIKILNVQASYNPGAALIEATIIWDKTKKINQFHNHFGKKNREHDFVQEKFNEIFKRKIKKENSEAQFLRSKKRFLGVDLPEYIARSSSSHGRPDQLSRSLLVSLRQKMISAG